MPAADHVIARLAAERNGLVTRALLLAEGVTTSAIEHRLNVGRLRPVHRGVYTTTHGELSETQVFLAAVLAAGPGAVLSHGSAAALWRILTTPAGPPEVLRAGPNREGPRGVRLRMTAALPPTDTTTHRGVPVTTLARTLLDLAATGTAARLELALDEARARRLVAPHEIAALAASSRRGSAVLRALLATGPGFTRSEAERRLRALVRRARLPPPRTNVRVHGHEVDAFWPEQRLVFEVDGYAAHATRTAFERDRRRDQELTASGIRVARVSWLQLTREPEAVVARLAAALAIG